MNPAHKCNMACWSISALFTCLLACQQPAAKKQAVTNNRSADSNWIMLPFVKTGSVNPIEGLVHFNNEWLLYYGTADSKIAVCQLVK